MTALKLDRNAKELCKQLLDHCETLTPAGWINIIEGLKELAEDPSLSYLIAKEIHEMGKKKIEECEEHYDYFFTKTIKMNRDTKRLFENFMAEYEGPSDDNSVCRAFLKHLEEKGFEIGDNIAAVNLLYDMYKDYQREICMSKHVPGIEKLDLSFENYQY